MSKELEYEIKSFANLANKDCMNLMECLKKQDKDNKPIFYLGKHFKKVILPYEEYQKMFNRLESIDNANPSEALEKFDYIENDIKFAFDDDYISYDYTDDVEYIKQALIKAEKEHNALEIIKKNPFESASCINYITINKNNYNMLDYKHYCMTIKDALQEEEFELLRSVLI